MKGLIIALSAMSISLAASAQQMASPQHQLKDQVVAMHNVTMNPAMKDVHQQREAAEAVQKRLERQQNLQRAEAEWRAQNAASIQHGRELDERLKAGEKKMAELKAADAARRAAMEKADNEYRAAIAKMEQRRKEMLQHREAVMPGEEAIAKIAKMDNRRKLPSLNGKYDEKLDSIVVDKETKWELECNEEGLAVRSSYYTWDESKNDWKETNRSTHSWDDKGRRTRYESNVLGSNGQLYIDYYYTYSYNDETGIIGSEEYRSDDEGKSYRLVYKWDAKEDANGHMIYSMSYRIDEETGVATPRSCEEYVRDANGYVVEEKYADYDAETQTMVPTRHIFSTYDEKGSPTSSKVYEYRENGEEYLFYTSQQQLDKETGYVVNSSVYYNIDGSVNYAYRADNKYDDMGNTLARIEYSWDNEANGFYARYKYEYTYDENGRQNSYARYNIGSDGWEGDSKREWTFDEFGNESLSCYYAWNSETNDWVSSSKYVYAYDENGHQLNFEYYYRSTDGTSWIGGGKQTYVYEKGDTPVSTTYYEWNSSTQDWQPFERDVVQVVDGVRESIEYRYNNLKGGEEYVNALVRYQDVVVNGETIVTVDEYWYYDIYAGKLMNDRKRTVEFIDGDTNKRIYTTMSYYNADTEDWNYGERSTNYYNESGTCYYNEFLMYYDGLWRDGNLSTTERGEHGKITLEVHCQDWNPEANAWRSGSKDVYTYDEAGRQLEHYSYKISNYEWQLSSYNAYTYNAAGVETSYEYSNYQDGKQYYGARGEYVYDASGKQTEFKFFMYDSVAEQWIFSNRVDYVYENDLLVRRDGYNVTSDGVDVPADYSTYEYDAEGRLTKRSIYLWQDGTSLLVQSANMSYEGDICTELTEDYDEMGQMTRRHKTEHADTPLFWMNKEWNWVDDAWVATNYYYNERDERGYTVFIESHNYDAYGVANGGYRTHTDYDDAGRQTYFLKEDYNPDGQCWYPSSNAENHYDAEGRLTYDLFLYNMDQDDTWDYGYKFIYTYGENSKDTEYYDWYNSSKDFVPNSKNAVFYNAHGKEIGWASYYYDYQSDGSIKWIGSNYDIREVDDEGREILREQRSWNYEAGFWCDGFKREYSYDENGKVIYQADYYGSYDSSDWRQKNTTEYSDNGYDYSSYEFVDGNWVGTYKTGYVYREDGSTDWLASYDWDAATNRWRGNYHNNPQPLYDEYDNLVWMTSYTWDDTTWAWNEVNETRTYTYDLDADASRIANTGSPKKILSVHHAYSDGRETDEIYYYSPFRPDPNGINSVTAPADAPRYDLQGRRVADPHPAQLYIQGGKKQIK